MHLDLDHAVARAGLAAAALDVEAEAPGLPAARARLGQAREEIADAVEGLGVGAGVGPRRAADRPLVDRDDLVEVLEPLDRFAVGSDPRGALLVERARQRRQQDAVDQRALARPR